MRTKKGDAYKKNSLELGRTLRIERSEHRLTKMHDEEKELEATKSGNRF